MRGRTKDTRPDAFLLDALAQALIAPELPGSRWTLMRERVLACAADSPPPDTETTRGGSVPWVPAWAGVTLRVMRRDRATNLQVTVLRMEPGSTIPAHAHVKEEECLVLEGEILIGSHKLRQGDFHLVHPGGRHPDIASPSGALLLIRSEIPSMIWTERQGASGSAHET